MSLRREHDGATAPMSFAIAGAILVTVIGTALVVVQDGGSGQGSRHENTRQQADSILDLFVDSKGAGWESGADAATQVGLLNHNGSGLDLSRMQTYKGALYEATLNGKMDYEESLVLLGMDPQGPAHFHLRVAPVGLLTVLTEDLGRIRTAYVADTLNFDTAVTVASGTDVEMAGDARLAYSLHLDLLTVQERAAIRELGLGFDDLLHVKDAGIQVDLGLLGTQPIEDAVFDTSVLLGDVFPDQKQYLDNVLHARLDAYEILIIGSNVDHSALTSEHVKSKVTEWVHAGGTLIVFGSDSKSFKWLESTMGVGIETVNGGAFAPDVDHPILREPYALDWPAYDTFEQAWGGKNDKSSGGKSFDELFQHVIQDDDGDVLAISRDGAFGAGTVFLTTFRPADIAHHINLRESMNLINNIVVYTDRSYLFLDYGPAPPRDAAVGAAARSSHVWDERYGQVPVRVTVLTWGM